MSKLLRLTERFSGLKIAVLGDLMLDRYIWGYATRISQEAPVPVVEVHRSSSVPGGAANVVRNIIGLGASSGAYGCIGNDLEGKELLELLQQAGADTQGIVFDPQRQTTVKTRVFASNQQVVRIDRECHHPINNEMRKQLLTFLQKTLLEQKIGALILEDYAKGIFDQEFMQETCNLARQAGIFTTLDPHPTHNYSVHGLKLMTPNRSEAFALAGLPYQPGINNPQDDPPLLAVGSAILQKWQPALLLITLGAEGMALFQKDNPLPLHIPTQARQVFDVSGAGDTVMATMTLALLAGASPEDAARLANAAAGVVVGYVGTTAITADALKEKLLEL
ncbi:MAG: PfkB family carbohydrate kinase [Lentisphaeria bacterium]